MTEQACTTLTLDLAGARREVGDRFGLFFEDLNHAADGGLYAELVRNRSFEFEPADGTGLHALTAWRKVERGASLAELHVETANPLNRNNVHHAVLEVLRPGMGAGLQNEGYNGGIPVSAGESYRFSCWCRHVSATGGPVLVRLEDSEGEICHAEASFQPAGSKWAKVTLMLQAATTDPKARLTLLAQEPMTLALDMISLFPANTFKGRENGMRPDIAEMLQAMRPRFLRFPGGCLVHCGSLNPEDHNSLYRWKNTIGPIEERPARRNTWGYSQSFGLGFYEYFQFCEDIGAKPIPVLAAGFDPHTLRAVPLDEMQPWVDDALDLIEFANGGVGTVWGAKRAEMGHPAPFGMTYLAIGNEEVGEAFFERFRIIVEAVRERYPEIRIIGTGGPGAAGSPVERGWQVAREMNLSYVDEHYYMTPEWFLANLDRYADLPAEGPQVFLGEYASKDDRWRNALAEAAFLIGLEKAPAVGLACYAPLLCNKDYVNWKPNLVWYDGTTVVGTACYQVQKLFMAHQGDRMIPLTLAPDPGMVRIPASLKGTICFETTRSDVTLSDLRLTNLETGENRFFPGGALSAESPSLPLCTNEWDHWSMSFTFIRRSGAFSELLAGSRAFELVFGETGEGDRCSWELEGWQRLLFVRSTLGGRVSDYAVHPFASNLDEPVHCRMVVQGGRIQTFVEDQPYADVLVETLETAGLLAVSSWERETDDVILKAVNLSTEPVAGRIALAGQFSRTGITDAACSIKAHTLAGYAPSDANSFDEPHRVQPKIDTFLTDGPDFPFVFPPESLVVLRISR